MFNNILLIIKKNLMILVLFMMALLIRTYRLDRIPVGVIHDELNYILNAKSLYQTGTNIPLTASALLSWGEDNFDVVISELPSILLAPVLGPLHLNQFIVRLPYVIMSSASVVLLYLIVKKLLNKNIAFFGGMVLALNPWSIHIGRTALEVNFASFFFLLSAYLLLVKDKIILSYFTLIAMFFSYLGAKLQFFPLALILYGYKYFSEINLKPDIRKYLFIIMTSALIIFLYTISIAGQPSGSRTNELIFFEKDWASSVVNDERRQALPNLGLELFTNKATIILRRISDVYLKGFSTTNLFSRGERVAVYSIWEYGQFHVLDFFLILMGTAALFKYRRKVFWLVLFVILLSPWVSSIDLVEQTFAIRAYPMFPFLAILSGMGFWFIRTKIKFGHLISAVIAFLYIVSASYFMNLYIYRFPIYASERWFFGERILSNYVDRLSQKSEVKSILISSIENPKNVFEKYLFYLGYYDNKDDIKKANGKLNEHDFSWGKIKFIHGCPDDQDVIKSSVLVSQASLKCQAEEAGKTRIADLKDAGTVFVISEEKLCSDIQLGSYYRPVSLDQFSMEQMSREQFCKNWIVKL